jgi:hypothetical protein
LHVLAKLALPDDRSRAIELSREAAELFRAGAAPLDGVLSLFLWGKLLHENGDRKGAALIAEAAERVRGRLEELRDPDLRRSYLALPDVQAILGHDAAQLPS